MKYLINILFFLLLSVGYAQTTKYAATASKSYTTLKAVLVVGTDYNKKISTEGMDSIMAFFKRKGVKTYCFYDTASHWNKIREAARGAHFFIYMGHGSRGGGLNVASGGGNKDISELQLAKNAVVGFQSVCFGAGSSASDDNEISISEAAKRVNWYAEPFIKAGAGCYYANNWNDGVLSFLRGLFSGDTFEHYRADTTMPFSIDTSKKISLHSNNLGGTVTKTSYKNGVKTVINVPSHKSFDVAWVSNPRFSIKDVEKNILIKK
jgi:hypothetical protein